MNIKKRLLFLFLLWGYFLSVAQNTAIQMEVVLDNKKDILHIDQEIVFYNNTNEVLKKIYLHNWANSFKHRKTPLAKRFVEDYTSDFYFSEDKDKGESKIRTLTINNQSVTIEELPSQQDIIKVNLSNELLPKDSVSIAITYTVKIPDARFTAYGKTRTGYHLRYWYITPSVYQNGWQVMSNLNIDDLYEASTDFTINFILPKDYFVESNLSKQGSIFKGKNKKDIIISINNTKEFRTFKQDSIVVKTDFYDVKKSDTLVVNIIDKQLRFIQDNIGTYPHKEIFIDKNSINKTSLYSAFTIPSFLNPYPKNFLLELNFFNALSHTYINDVLLLNKRTDKWLLDGLQTYMMIKYIEKYYPELTVLGKYSKIWGVRSYTFSKLKYNNKYPFVYQFSSRKFYNQPLTMRADSLSNFNRKVVNKYKAGIGLHYLNNYLQDSILEKSIKEFYKKNQLRLTSSADFSTILKSKTSKNLNWFFGDFLQSKKKIDYTIQKIKKKKDSLRITIKNKRNITVPVKLYALKNDSIRYIQWISNIDSTKTVNIKNNSYDKLTLNYEKICPEHNIADNWKKVNKALLNKPIQIRFFKDVHNPNYNQLFIDPDVKYNYYDGIIVGLRLHNKPILERNFEFMISPKYGLGSQSLTGSFSTVYNQYIEEGKLYKITYGIGGSNYHYTKNLSYTSFTPFVNIRFKRKTLRDVGGSGISASHTYIDKQVADTTTVKEKDKYGITNIAYYYSKPKLLKGFQFFTNTELSSSFGKLNTDIRYRQYIGKYRNLYLRFFGGLFLYNNTKSDYFSYGLDRGNDYLFKYGLFGGSETTGLFSQQYVIADGGFKSKFDNSLANQFLLAGNSSISLWHWIEFYNDAAFYKNKNFRTHFAYENGIRLNFVPNVFEFYFPLYTNQNGWQLSKKAYPSKIRFTFRANINAIYDFFRRGLL